MVMIKSTYQMRLTSFWLGRKCVYCGKRRMCLTSRGYVKCLISMIMANKSDKNYPFIYQVLWVLWILFWMIVPFRLIRPFFFDKFIYLKDPEYGYVRNADGGWFCSADLNSDGFRDIEFYPKKDSEFLILVVGDSLVYGQGLRIKDRFSNLLQKRLNKIRKTRVYNLGRCGANIYRNYVNAEKYRKKLNPNLIIFTLFENDLLINEDLSDFPNSIDQSVSGRKIVYEVGQENTPVEYYQQILETFDENTVNYSMLMDLMPQMPRDKTLYYLLTYWEPNTNPFKLLEVFNQHGFPIINNFALYFEKYEKLANKKLELQISPKETHPNAIANQMFTERLYQEIISNPQWGFTEK